MQLSQGPQLWIQKQQLENIEFQVVDVSPLSEGQVRLQLDEFAFTANNITYAAMGDALQYWRFFPTSDDAKGIIPVWGFAQVVESLNEEITVGERVYGYFPMAESLIVNPGHISKNNFMDVSDHRNDLAMVYNQYLRCAADPLYNSETEALQMLLRPLFTTSFLIDDFYDDNDCFGAEQFLLSSASSKTALGTAFALKHNRAARNKNYRIVGLTSAANKAFVESLACYDDVITYDEIENLDASLPSTVIDFAGNGQVLGRVHQHFDQQLKYSCMVGASHWDQRAGLPSDLAGPAPQLFFAPTQAEKRIKEWGGEEFGLRLARVWFEFSAFADDWMQVEIIDDIESIKTSYKAVLAGQLDPAKGLIYSIKSSVE